MLEQDSFDLLCDSVDRVLHERYDFASYQRIRDSELGWSREMWEEFVELGWMGLTVPEEDGGLGATPVQCLQLHERTGAALVLEPLLPTLLIAGEVVRAVQDVTARQALANGLIDGEVRLSLAPRQTDSGCFCTATVDGDGYRLQGDFPTVLEAASATHLLIPAQLGNELVMFLVPQTLAGVDVTPIRMIDGRWSGSLHIDTTLRADMLLSRDHNWCQRLEDLVTVGCVAEAVGLLQAALSISVEYTKMRKQFGQPLSSLQAVQHAMAEVYVVVEQMRSLLKAVGEGLEDAERPHLVSAAKAYLGRAGYGAMEKCIQFHGGIGVTEEYKVGHYYKRLLVIGATYGGVSEHLQKMARQISNDAA